MVYFICGFSYAQNLVRRREMENDVLGRENRRVNVIRYLVFQLIEGIDRGIVQLSIIGKEKRNKGEGDKMYIYRVK